jgi:large subunit ribosomal protein L14e
MGFKKFVEIGRVAIVNYGPLAGKVAVIVDILNTTRVLIHGPKEGVRRQEISLKRLTLTDFKLDIKRGIHKDNLVKAIEEYKLDDKFKESNYAKKVEKRKLRANLTDFDRFKVMRLRQKRAVLRHIAINGPKKSKAPKKK